MIRMLTIVKTAAAKSKAMKNKFLLCFWVFTLFSLKAQTQSFQMNPEPPSAIVRLSLIAPKLSIEFAPIEDFTLSAGFWLYPSLWNTNENNQRIYHPTISPSFTFEPKYYFNLADRADKGKRTDYYSGWYIGLPFAIRFPDLSYSLGATIGFQCTMGKRWFWNFGAGPGFSYYDTHFHMSGAGSLSLGIILNKM